ncbi:hypothetical protein [Noviherbaspirillum cavernae]|uniref:hypothetical protein n=1 Tax=Noviherbaspirillum cavernae TaxID=2320862 RepID=UPI0011C43DD0|nr:hypothetical protein [Noviherbaspirillum cavernae]
MKVCHAAEILEKKFKNDCRAIAQNSAPDWMGNADESIDEIQRIDATMKFIAEKISENISIQKTQDM